MTEDTPGHPLVSVVIPAYNAERTIVSAVDSVLAQRYPRLEVLVIDDGSTDGTAAALEGFGDRIRVVRQPNGGLPAARNRSHQEAQGEFIAWLDADDLMNPDRIALQVEFLQQHPSVVLVSSEFSAFFEDGRVVERFADTYYSRIPDAGGVEAVYPQQATLVPRAAWCADAWTDVQCRIGDVRRDIEWGNVVHPPTIMFRRELLEHAGGLDARGGPAADWEFFVRASGVGPFGLITVPLIRYRMHPGQMSGPANSRASILGQLYVYKKTHGNARGLQGVIRRNWSAAHAELYAGLARHELERNRWAAASYLGLALAHRPPLKVVLVLLALMALPVGLRDGLIAFKRRYRPTGRVGHLLLMASYWGDMPLTLLAGL